MSNIRIVVSRRMLILLAVAVVVFFLLANVLYTHHGLLRTVSDVTWGCFLLGALLLIVLGVVALLQSRQPERR